MSFLDNDNVIIIELRYDLKQGIYIKVYLYIRGVNKLFLDCFFLNIKFIKKNKFKFNLEDMYILRFIL